MAFVGAASLMKMMPQGYEEACYSTKAMRRKRVIRDPNDLMLLSLFHLLTGCSLVEISEISKLTKIGNISDVGFMKRFSNCSDWFKWVLTEIQKTSKGIVHYEMPDHLSKYRILAVDASDVSEKGSYRRIFRLHFALDIVRMHAALYNITSNNVGEHLRNFDFSSDDLVLADRGYSNVTGMEYCFKKGCQYIVRMRKNGFNLYDSEGNKLNLLSLMKSKGSGEVKAFVHKDENRKTLLSIPVRVCFKKKPKEALDYTRKKLKEKEHTNQMKFSKEAHQFNEYVVLVTSLDDSVSAEEVLELYKYRWQVELYFKRLKSILDYGEIPKKSEKSIFSWLNGKLMIALLIETMLGKAKFPPYTHDGEECLEGDENNDALAVYKSD